MLFVIWITVHRCQNRGRHLSAARVALRARYATRQPNISPKAPPASLFRDCFFFFAPPAADGASAPRRRANAARPISEILIRGRNSPPFPPIGRDVETTRWNALRARGSLDNSIRDNSGLRHLARQMIKWWITLRISLLRDPRLIAFWFRSQENNCDERGLAARLSRFYAPCYEFRFIRRCVQSTESISAIN